MRGLHRLTAPEVRTAAVGLHADGGDLCLQVTEARMAVSGALGFFAIPRTARNARWV
jgi:hypothetical protein